MKKVRRCEEMRKRTVNEDSPKLEGAEQVEQTGRNPFSVDFGREPKEYIPRTLLMRDLVESFMEEEPSQHVSIITGVRGCGKTVFMNNACGEFLVSCCCPPRIAFADRK